MLLSVGTVVIEYENYIVMLTMVLWGVGTFLEVLVLARGYQQRLLSGFPIFYGYLLFVAIGEFVRFFAYRWSPDYYYYRVYWVTQFLGLAIGSLIIFEIYRVALRSFPGTAKMARWMLLLVFGAIFARSFTNSAGGVFAWFAQTTVELERNLRVVQALAILTLVFLFFWYAIPFGRNLKGILVGYGLFIGMSIARFVLWYHLWDKIKPYWTDLGAVTFLLVLCVWAVSLWSAQPAPQLKPEIRLEQDYELLVASTRDQFRRTLTRLGWAARG